MVICDWSKEGIEHYRKETEGWKYKESSKRKILAGAKEQHK